MSKNGIKVVSDNRTSFVRAEVDRLLTCIADGADHYRVLNIDRESTVEKVRRAYCRAVDQLHPLNCQDIVDGDGALRWKLSEAFLRIVEAFSVLSSPGRRVEYDGLLNRRPVTPLPMPRIPEPRRALSDTASADGHTNGDPSTGKVGIANAFGHSEVNAPKVKDRRRAQRLALRLRVRVSSRDNDWEEVSETSDVSRTGVKLRLLHYPQPGTILVLELPMPLALRNHHFHDGLYVVKAIVRHSRREDDGYLVGLEFQDDFAEAIGQAGESHLRVLK